MSHLPSCIFAALVVCQAITVYAQEQDFSEQAFPEEVIPEEAIPEQVAPRQAAPGQTGEDIRTTPRYMECLANCQTVQQYDPVCGDNDETFHNRMRLRCAQSCGLNVQQSHRGTCRPSAAGK